MITIDNVLHRKRFIYSCWVHWQSGHTDSLMTNFCQLGFHWCFDLHALPWLVDADARSGRWLGAPAGEPYKKKLCWPWPYQKPSLVCSDHTRPDTTLCNIIKYLKPVLFCCCFPSDRKPLHNTASIQCQETFKIYQQLLCLEMLCACKEVAHGSTQQHWSMDCYSAKRVWTEVQAVAIDWNVSLTLGVYSLKEEISWSSGTRQLSYTSFCLKLQKPVTKLSNR